MSSFELHPVDVSLYTTTNDELPFDLVPKYKGLIQNVTKSISAIDDEILALKFELEKRYSARKALEAERSTHELILAPIRSLPNELIATIAGHVLPHPSLLTQTDRTILVGLLLVCRRWRQVISSTPTLWRGLEIQVLSPWSIQDLTSWFGRAGEGTPLRLVVLGPPWKKSWLPPSSLQLHPFLQCQPSRNWFELGFYRLTSHFIMRIFEDAHEEGKGSFLHPVRRLGLDLQDDEPHDVLKLSSTILPCLENLHIDRWAFSVQRLTLDLSSLTSLHLSRCTAPASVYATTLSFDNLPLLQEVVLEYCDIASPVPTEKWTSVPISPRVNQVVRRLVIAGISSIHSVEEVVFPNLHLLGLIDLPSHWTRNPGQAEVERDQMLCSFMRHSSKRLHTLSLERASLGPRISAQLVGIVAPTLHHLHIHDFDFATHLPKSFPPVTIEKLVVFGPFLGTSALARIQRENAIHYLKTLRDCSAHGYGSLIICTELLPSSPPNNVAKIELEELARFGFTVEGKREEDDILHSIKAHRYRVNPSSPLNNCSRRPTYHIPSFEMY